MQLAAAVCLLLLLLCVRSPTSPIRHADPGRLSIQVELWLPAGAFPEIEPAVSNILLSPLVQNLLWQTGNMASWQEKGAQPFAPADMQKRVNSCFGAKHSRAAFVRCKLLNQLFESDSSQWPRRASTVAHTAPQQLALKPRGAS